jgi:hypothetical protein
MKATVIMNDFGRKDITQYAKSEPGEYFGHQTRDGVYLTICKVETFGREIT